MKELSLQIKNVNKYYFERRELTLKEILLLKKRDKKTEKNISSQKYKYKFQKWKNIWYHR